MKPATPPPLTPEETKAQAKKIALVGVVDAVLIFAGIGLYFLTDNIAYPIIAAVAGMAVMVIFVLAPQIRRQIAATKASKGGGLVQ